MLYSKTSNVNVNSNHLKYYRNLGYACNVSDLLEVNSEHLPKGSHAYVDVQCDTCSCINSVQFRSIKDKINFEYSCKSCASKKRVKKFGTCFTNPELQRELSLRNNLDSLNKRKETKLNKYGDENYNNQSKRKETLKNNHGDINYNNQSKKQETCTERYGDINYNNQSKKQETCIERYGVSHTNHVPEIFKKIQKSAFKTSDYKNTNLTYQGSYEYDFLEFCESKGIEVNNGPTFNYIFNGVDRLYFSDFIIHKYNLIVEIKSSYTFNHDFSRNIAKKDSAIQKGYNFIFIIDKNYEDFLKYIKD